MVDSVQWALADDIARGLVSEIPGAVGRVLTDDETGTDDHFFALGPTDDRSAWHWFDAQTQRGNSGALRVAKETLSSASRSLTLVMTALNASEAGSRGWRWRLAARIIEASYPLVAEHASSGNAEASRLLPLVAWVRWRILSEPFRTAMAERPADPAGIGSFRGEDPDGPLAYARGAFSGFHSLERRTRESRTGWAEMLLRYHDHPALGTIDPEREGKLLVFTDTSEKQLLGIGTATDRVHWRAESDATFLTWFSREFFSRRFMVSEMWRTVRSPWKSLTAGAAAAGVGLAVTVALLIPPETQLLVVDGISGTAQITVAALFLLSLTVTIGSLVAGIVWSSDDERYAYPFLLRFGAGTVLGSAAVIAMRAGWISNLSNPGPGNNWRPWLLVAGLFVAGFTYLLVEARLHGTTPGRVFRRAFAVWCIGLVWALTISAIDVLAIAPVFTEDYFYFSEPDTRIWAFTVTALASLDLGIFLQSLWEDRPVSYPLGALRFSRNE